MENEYNKRFKNKEMSNDDFDVEGLWDNIEEELDATSPSDNTPIPSWKKYGAIFLVLVLFSGLGYILLNDDNMIAQNEQEYVKQSPELSEEESIQNKDLSSNLNKENSIDNVAKMNVQKDIFSNKTNTRIEKKTDSIVSTNAGSSLQGTTEKSNSNIGTGAKNISSKIDRKKSINTNSSNSQTENGEQAFSSEFSNKNELDLLENTIQEAEKTSTESVLIDAETELGNTETNGEIPVADISKTPPDTENKITPFRIHLSSLNKSLPIIEDSLLYTGIREIKINKKLDKKSKILFEGNLYGGVNLTNFKFKSINPNDDSLAMQKNPLERSILGQTHGLNLSALRKGVRVNTGVEYHNLWTKFDLEAENNTTALVEQALTLVVIDSIGNTVNRERRDTLINATTTRNIEHYNNYQVWSIPLEIGMYRARKKWSYGISAGTSFNFLSNQSGKTLDSNAAVLEFDKTSDNTLIQSFSMSLRANVFLAYHLNEKVRLSVVPKWSWTRHDIFNRALQSEVQQFGLTLGLRSTF